MPEIVVLVVVCGVVLLLYVPRAQARHLVTVRQRNQFDAENEARRTLVQMFGGAFFLGGLAFTWLQLQTAERGRSTDQFTEAVTLLSSDSIITRIAGVHALDDLAATSDAYRAPVLKTLSAYVRLRAARDAPIRGTTIPYFSIQRAHQEDLCVPSGFQAPRPPFEEAEPKPDVDVVAVVEVLAQRKWTSDVVPNLGNTMLGGLTLEHARLSGAILLGTDLRGADLRYAQLADTSLRFANLFEADLRGARAPRADLCLANLLGASLHGATLRGVDLRGANLRGAHFDEADLTGARLEHADLTGAVLTDAQLSGATFDNAVLSRTDLRGTDLSEAVNLPAWKEEDVIIDQDTKLPSPAKR